MTPKDTQKQLQKQLPHLRIGPVFKAGAYSHLFKAKNNKQETLLIKTPDLSQDATLAMEFLKREIQALKNIQANSIPRLHDFNLKANSLHFLILPYFSGPTASQLMNEKNNKQDINICIKMANALSHVHQHNFLHLDVKPEHFILNTKRKNLMLIDFSNSKRNRNAEQKTVGLTPFYAAPELWKQNDLGVGTDIFALGVSFCCLLLGEYPFKPQNIQTKITKKIVETIKESILKDKPIVESDSKQLSNLIFAMLEKKRNNRPRSVCHVISELESIRKSL